MTPGVVPPAGVGGHIAVLRQSLRSRRRSPAPRADCCTDADGNLGFDSLGVGKGAKMGMMNRRNAVLGWIVWEVGKRVAKKKARAAVPGIVDDSMRPNRSAIALLVLLAVGAVWFVRKLVEDEDGFEPAG
jgi:hypothetical protein